MGTIAGRPPAAAGRPAQPAAIVDVAGCGAPRLRAAAEAMAGRPVAVVGTLAEAERAAEIGLRVVASCAPPLGDVARARRPLLEAIGGPRPMGSAAAFGPRAVAAARLCGVRVDPATDALPSPLPALDAASVRAGWGAAPADLACVLLACPPAAGDARLALDLAGRAAMLGGRVVLVVHPEAGLVAHARRFADAVGGAWCMVTDGRAEEPELLAAAADLCLAVPAVPGPEGDPLAVRLALRAGMPVVTTDDAPGAGLVDAALRFDRRRPNVGARLMRESAAGRLSARA